MGDSPVTPAGPPTGLDRRTALKRGALVGGALVWAVPVVQAVSLTAAHAENPSAPPPNNPPNNPPEQPPNNPPNNPPGTNVPPNQPPTQGQPFAPPAGSATPTPSGRTGQLAFTGPGLPVVPTVAVAASLIATGAAAQAVGRRRTPDGEPGPDYDQPEQNPAG